MIVCVMSIVMLDDSIPNKILRTLQAPALGPAENNEKALTYSQNFENAPHASVRTRREHRESRPSLTPENAPHTHHGAAHSRTGSSRMPRIDAPRASITTRQEHREGCHVCPDF